ncbi:hypothetical protein QLX67_12205, partial [Balneolaceae bacterium ANBcel3]|nr:hypothetical protein [Balneolaceae bacterium ANBcel3]
MDFLSYLSVGNIYILPVAGTLLLLTLFLNRKKKETDKKDSKYKVYSTLYVVGSLFLVFVAVTMTVNSIIYSM